MADQLLSNISQDQFDTAEQVIISMLRAAYPTLDLRRGTVLRDIVIRPAASVYAMNTANIADLTAQMSLITLQANPTATADQYNAVLSNFGTSLGTGTVSNGKILITVDSVREYTIGAGVLFTDIAGKQYQTLDAYTARQGGTGTGSDLPLYSNTDGSYYFILPVTATTVGADGNIEQGTALTPASSIYGFLAADAYATFAGGTDAETVDAALVRLPAAISYRALESDTSIDAKLRNAFSDGSVSIQRISVAGYGDRTQLRDKHNPMGFAVGSRVDVYVRTFTAPRVVTLKKTGTRTGSGTYQFTVDAVDAPGFTVLRSVSEVESVLAPTLAFGTLVVAGSYPFTEVRSATGLTSTKHDISSENSMVETAFTKYQKTVVTVTNVPATTSTHDFKVEVYAPDGIDALQTYVDDASISNVEADYIVRSPLMCMVEMQGKVYCSAANPVTADVIKAKLASYINTRSFVTQLTRSELVNIMFSSGVTRVDLGTQGLKLFGAVRDAAGVVHTMSGDSLRLDDVSAPTALLAYETTVFATEPQQLQIEVITE